MLQGLVLENDSIVVLSVHVYIHLQLVLNSLQLSSETVFVLLKSLDLLLSQLLILLLGLTDFSTKNVICRGWLAVGLNLVHDLSEPGLVLILELVGDLIQGKFGRVVLLHVHLELVIVDVIVSLELLELVFHIIYVLAVLLDFGLPFSGFEMGAVDFGLEVL